MAVTKTRDTMMGGLLRCCWTAIHDRDDIVGAPDHWRCPYCSCGIRWDPEVEAWRYDVEPA